MAQRNQNNQNNESEEEQKVFTQQLLEFKRLHCSEKDLIQREAQQIGRLGRDRMIKSLRDQHTKCNSSKSFEDDIKTLWRSYSTIMGRWREYDESTELRNESNRDDSRDRNRDNTV